MHLSGNMSIPKVTHYSSNKTDKHIKGVISYVLEKYKNKSR